MNAPRLSREKCERALNRLYDERRELEKHPNYPWIDEIPGYMFVCDEIDFFEDILYEWECEERGL